jgi:hypothetical protein
LTPIEIPSQSDRATAICDASGDDINAYQMGLIRLTLNPTASLPEVSTANNSRDITSPNWVGADIEIIGGSLAVALVLMIRSFPMCVSKISAISGPKPCRGSLF